MTKTQQENKQFAEFFKQQLKNIEAFKSGLKKHYDNLVKEFDRLCFNDISMFRIINALKTNEDITIVSNDEKVALMLAIIAAKKKIIK